MPIVTKKVEIQIVKLTPDELNFEDLLLSEYLKRPFNHYGKAIQLNYLEDKGDYLIGVMVTTKKTGIPPKHNTETDEFNPLDLKPTEGLGYANVFIYDKNLKILMYEFNKNGTYLTAFIEYINAYCNGQKEFEQFSLHLDPLLNMQTYEKMLAMRFYKQLEIKIAQPTELIAEYKGTNESVKNTLKLGKESHTDYLTLILNVNGRRKEGLLDNFVTKYATQFLGIGKKNEDDLIKKFTIKGYEIDQDGENVPSTIDLITDRYRAEFKIDEPRILQTIQVTERKGLLIELYKECKKEFKDIVKIQGKRKVKKSEN